MPDLLSTAVALHALDGLQVSYRDAVEPCLDFIDSLWTAAGGFHGNWNDEELDLEYTYYGLLALGHLSLS
jgi:prenyltransferase beta subunit